MVKQMLAALSLARQKFDGFVAHCEAGVENFNERQIAEAHKLLAELDHEWNVAKGKVLELLGEVVYEDEAPAPQPVPAVIPAAEPADPVVDSHPDPLHDDAA